MRITISECGLADLDDLVPLFDAYRRFYRQDSDRQGARAFLLERLVKRDTVLLIGRNEHDRPMGFTHLFPSFSSVRMASLWILNDLYVAPEVRGRGVGRQLMHAARERALSEGVAILALATEKDNHRAKALYERLGYERDTAYDHYELVLQEIP